MLLLSVHEEVFELHGSVTDNISTLRWGMHINSNVEALM
jgi:hypothetical protein